MVKPMAWKLSASEERVRDERIEECGNCSRIHWTHFRADICTTLDAQKHVEDVMQSRVGSYSYLGVTFSIQDRCHFIRYRDGRKQQQMTEDKSLAEMEKDATDVAHFPRWPACSPLIYGPLGPILHLEKKLISQFSPLLTNDEKKGGVGTAQPMLFLYLCHGSTIKCGCQYCRSGRRVAFGDSESSDPEPWDFYPAKVMKEEQREDGLQPAASVKTEEEEDGDNLLPKDEEEDAGEEEEEEEEGVKNKNDDVPQKKQRLLRKASSKAPTELDSSEADDAL